MTNYKYRYQYCTLDVAKSDLEVSTHFQGREVLGQGQETSWRSWNLSIVYAE